MILATFNFVQRWASNIDKAAFNKLSLIAIEESQYQCTNMSAIYISVGHDHNAMVTKIFNLKIFALNSQAQSSDQRLDFSIFVDLGIISFLNIENLATKREDGLISPITTLLG